jgi:hypothetical protein
MSACTHLQSITSIRPPLALECEDCMKIGGSWVHLRTCQECGVTRCCDQSPNQHSRKHALAASHPIIASAQPDEHWLYCFPDDVFVDY